MTLPDTIHPALRAALARKGYETLTDVQGAVLAGDAFGRDLLVSAQTGSGKTVAFGIAMAMNLLGDADTLPHAQSPLALVIAPTRELALQVQRELGWLYGDAGARIASAVGGMDPRAERRAMERGAHIIVGTPGRLKDHIERGALDLSAIRAIVLDEADEMLDFGFREDLEFILGSAPKTAGPCSSLPRCRKRSRVSPRPISQMPCVSPPSARPASTPTLPMSCTQCRRGTARMPSSMCCAITVRRARWCSAVRAKA